MLILVAVWLCLIGVFFVVGVNILNLLKADCFNRLGDRFILSVWLGILLAGILLLGISLLIPLTPALGITLSVLLLGTSLVSKSTRTELLSLRKFISFPWLLGSLTLAFGVAAIVSGEVTWIDTGLYHFQVIKWLSEFGAVPGLAAIHSRFGFTSSWFALAAPLNAGLLEARMSAAFGGLAMFLILLHFFISLNHLNKKQENSGDLLIIISSFFSLFFIGISHILAKSASPDVVIIVLPILIAWSFLVISAQSDTLKNRLFDVRMVPLVLAAGAVSAKLSGAPLLPVAFLFYVGKKLDWKRIVVGCVVGFVLILPMLMFGVITSGCPLFPSSIMCLDLPWSVGKEAAHNLSDLIQSWARWSGPAPDNANNWNWIIDWTGRQKRASFLIASSIISLLSIHTILKKEHSVGQNWILATAILGIAFMFYGAPSWRFGVGYLSLLPSYMLAILARQRMPIAIAILVFMMFMLQFPLDRTAKLSISIGLVLFCLSIFLYQFHQASNRIAASFIIAILLYVTSLSQISDPVYAANINMFVLPHQMKPAARVPKRVNDLKYFSPATGNRCWANRLICTPYLTVEDIKLRDRQLGFRGGFVRQRNH